MENEDVHDEKMLEAACSYYVRPFIPFWSSQRMKFEDVNSYDVVPPQRDQFYPRYMREKLVRTWINKDKNWFDKREIFDILKENIVAMLESRYSPNKKLRKYLRNLNIVNPLVPTTILIFQNL